MAIAGLGTDIVEFSRFEKGDGANEGLARRVLTASAWAIFAESKMPSRYLAKRFAVKEAMVKALGTGIGNGVSWQHIEVKNNELGAPFLHLSGEVKRLCEQRGITRSFVSISDERHYAVATVILEM